MTRELERVLRATFEDRADPVPPPSTDLADSVIGRARAVRRRRALTGAVSAFVVAAFAGVTALTGAFGMVGDGDPPPSGDMAAPPITALGFDVAVPAPTDGSAPYLATGDGVRVPVTQGERVTEAVRVPDGFLALTSTGVPPGTDKAERLTHFALDGTATEIASGDRLTMRVSPNGDRVAVAAGAANEKAGGDLRVYALDGTRVGGEQSIPTALLQGWAGQYVVYDEGGTLQAWDPVTSTVFSAASETPLRFMGTVRTSGRDLYGGEYAYVAYEKGAEFCFGAADPSLGFQLIGPAGCYLSINAGSMTVSPDGGWAVAQLTSHVQDGVETVSGGYVYVDLRRDLTVSGGSSMEDLPAMSEVDAAVWLDDTTFVFHASDGLWYRTTMSAPPLGVTPLTLPGDPGTFPVPRTGP